MITTFCCAEVGERLLDYVEAGLASDEREAVERHVSECENCRASVMRSCAINALLQQSIGNEAIGSDAAAQIVARLRKPARVRESWPAASPARAPSGKIKKVQPPASQRSRHLPAWCVSVLLHLLVLSAAGLIAVCTHYEDQKSCDAVTELRFTAPVASIERNVVPIQADRLNAEPKASAIDRSLLMTAMQVNVSFEQASAIAEGHPALDLSDEDCRWAQDIAQSNSAETRTAAAGMFGSDGGKFGSVAVDGIAGGFGHTHFAQRSRAMRKRLVLSYGGSLKSERGVAAALRWLAGHQEADGRWSTKNTDGKGMHSSVGSLENWDPGVTGLALLAFLGAGNSETAGEYQDNVRRAVAWIISQQRDDGAIGTDPHWKHCFGEGYAYHHVICATALAEAAGMARVPATMKAAQLAVKFSCAYQSGEGQNKGGWRYYRNSSDADASMTGWFLTQLYTAQLAGLHVDRQSIEGGLRALQAFQLDPAQAKRSTEFADAGLNRYGYADHVTADPDATAMAGLCLLRSGAKVTDFDGASAWLYEIEKPEWRANLGHGWGGGWPMYFTYNATLFEFQVHGDHWPQWNEALQKMLLEHQRTDEDRAGSWDPQSDWEAMVGRAYTTALGALTLEVYYRFPLVMSQTR